MFRPHLLQARLGHHERRNSSTIIGTDELPRYAVWACWALLITLFVAHVAAYTQALAVIDSGRDLSNAWLIAQGEAWPLSGPGIYGTWSLGPVWFYLLAVPFLFSGDSLLPAAVWIGVLGAAKIPLAFVIGRRFYSFSGGVLFAALIGIPGWSSAESLVLAHTSVVESAVLLAILAAHTALLAHSLWRLALASLAFALAMHAHPTALLLAPWWAFASIRIAQTRGWVRTGATAGGFFALLWLPMLLQEHARGWPQLSATQGFAAAQADIWARLVSVPEVLYALLSGWPALTAGFWVPPLREATGALMLTQALLVLAALAGALVAAFRRPGLSLAVIGSAVLGLAIACALRPDVPPYMLYASFPFLIWALVHGLTQWPRRSVTWLGCALLIGAMVLQAGLLAERFEAAENGSVDFPGEAMSDVRAPIRVDSLVRFWLAAEHHLPIARRLCAESKEQLALHGELAAAFAWAGNTALQSTCGTLPMLGGRSAERHVVGIPALHARRLGILGPRLGGFVFVAPTEVLFPQQGMPAEVRADYAVDEYRQWYRERQPQRLTLQHSCTRGGGWLVINNLMAGLNAIEVKVDDSAQAIQPALTTIAAHYFSCPSGHTLDISIESINPAAIDVFALD